jgi:ubiquinone/menaquinone biosynthesis C-methylase UbiE
MTAFARPPLVAQLSGRVVEIGAGTGATFAHYPPTVTCVVAIEPDPRRRAVAIHAARRARVPIDVVDARAERLPLPDDAADAAVTSLALCSVRDVAAALAELRRVLRPGGELRFLEHVIAQRGPLRLLQRLVTPAYSRMPDGCHVARDALASIERAGFAIERCDRFMHRDGALEPAIPHVTGAARAAARDAPPPPERVLSGPSPRSGSGRPAGR